MTGSQKTQGDHPAFINKLYLIWLFRMRGFIHGSEVILREKGVCLIYYLLTRIWSRFFFGLSSDTECRRSLLIVLISEFSNFEAHRTFETTIIVTNGCRSGAFSKDLFQQLHARLPIRRYDLVPTIHWSKLPRDILRQVRSSEGWLHLVLALPLGS